MYLVAQIFSHPTHHVKKYNITVSEIVARHECDNFAIRLSQVFYSSDNTLSIYVDTYFSVLSIIEGKKAEDPC